MTQQPSRVLVVDDEPGVREVVSAYLTRDGHRVTTAQDAAGARAGFATHPDLVVLDVMLPGTSGLDLLAELRRTSDVPVILLTARAEEADRLRGLDLGADDYVVKPFSPREVAARVRSVLRRSNGAVVDATPLVHGELRVEPVARTATVAGRDLLLTPREFDLLAFLAAHPGRAFSRAELLARVWDSSSDWQDPATVTVHVRRVRTKLGGDQDAWLETVRGVGYRFRP
jgi:DNA-binding response OmpR family regulator